MSFVVTAVTAAVVSTGYTIYAGERANKQQKQAQAQATDAAQKQATAADKAFNAANKKKPNIDAMLANNQAAGDMGVGSTMLTGPGGVDPNMLTLGKNTLLGA
jgi:regulator of protease activity HflC (stomatin/prohibitin superfamily)